MQVLSIFDIDNVAVGFFATELTLFAALIHALETVPTNNAVALEDELANSLIAGLAFGSVLVD